MRLIVTDNYEQLSKQAANVIASQIILKPNSILGLATGSTPVGIYKELVSKCSRGVVDFSDVTTVNLDEYCGLSGESDQSYRYFMNTKLFNHININKNKSYLPDGLNENIDDECRHYDRLIDSLGGIDLQLLGLGNNGHIGFNEPDSAFPAGTHCVQLAQTTINANARFFQSVQDVPTRAITMGIKTIFSAKTILLVVSGEGKQEILCDILYGQITPLVPASILQLHTNLTVIADKAAAGLILKN